MTSPASYAVPNRTEQALRTSREDRAAYTAEVGPARVRADLYALKTTLAHQRTIKTGKVAAGEWTPDQYAIWVGRQATVELHIDTWLHELGVTHPADGAAVLAAAVQAYLDDPDADDEMLEDALHKVAPWLARPGDDHEGR